MIEHDFQVPFNWHSNRAYSKSWIYGIRCQTPFWLSHFHF